MNGVPTQTYNPHKYRHTNVSTHVPGYVQLLMRQVRSALESIRQQEQESRKRKLDLDGEMAELESRKRQMLERF